MLREFALDTSGTVSIEEMSSKNLLNLSTRTYWQRVWPAGSDLRDRRARVPVLRWPVAGLIATVEDPAVVGTILVRLGLLHPADSPGPATFTAQTTLPVE